MTSPYPDSYRDPPPGGRDLKSSRKITIPSSPRREGLLDANNKMINLLLRKSVVFIFYIICIALVSCVSVKEVPPGQISRIPGWKNLYYFHSEDSTWIVKPVPSAGNQFAGIVFKPEEIRKSRRVHIYATPLSSVKIENDRLSVPMENITKVENYKINAGTIITWVGVVTLLFLVPVFL